MGTVAGNQIAGSLPKVLQSMLDVLVSSNNLRSWQIYKDTLGISVRLRFDPTVSSEHDRDRKHGNVDMQGTEPGYTQQTQATAYSKKSPSHVRRDTQRRISRAKRQRTESDDVENERENASILTQKECDHIMDSPTYVCQPPIEDTLTLSPVLPISLDFGMDTLDQFHDYPHSDELRVLSSRL